MGPLGQYLPNWLPEDPSKNAAARQGLLTAGAALMGGRGNLGEILGGGLLAGSQGYNGAMQQQQQEQLRQAQMQQTQLENQKLQAAADEPMQLQKILSGGQAAPMGPPPGLPRIGGAPAAGSAPAPTGVAPAAPADQYSTLMGYAERLTQAGRPAQAKPYYEMAEKLRPKLMKQEARMVNGQRVMANVFEDGTTQQVEGFAPDAEKLHFANTGGSTVALDQFTGKPANTIQNTQSPDSVASGQVQMRGQNIAASTAQRGQNMTDSRAREALAQGKTPAGYRWSGDGKSLEPIPGGPVTAKTTEVQQKVGDAQSVLGLLDMAEPLVGKATSSYGGAALDQAARVFGGSTSGGESAAQLKAIEGSLISKMPKMSGPQSDKDVLLYRQMAGQIGDTTVPAANKMAAMKVIREINQRYLDQVQTQRVPSVRELPKKAAAAGAPAAGTVKSGYRFKGGNPADKANWEKV